MSLGSGSMVSPRTHTPQWRWPFGKDDLHMEEPFGDDTCLHIPRLNLAQTDTLNPDGNTDIPGLHLVRHPIRDFRVWILRIAAQDLRETNPTSATAASTKAYRIVAAWCAGCQKNRLVKDWGERQRETMQRRVVRIIQEGAAFKPGRAGLACSVCATIPEPTTPGEKKVRLQKAVAKGEITGYVTFRIHLEDPQGRKTQFTEDTFDLGKPEQWKRSEQYVLDHAWAAYEKIMVQRAWEAAGGQSDPITPTESEPENADDPMSDEPRQATS